MRQRYTGLLCVLAILLACLSFGVRSASAVRAAGTFTDTQGRFTFAIPDGLTPDDTYTGQRSGGAEIAAVLLSDATADSAVFHDNVNVTVTPFNGDTMNLDDLAQATVQRVSNALHATPDGTGIQSLTIAGLPAREYGYLAVSNGVTVHGRQAFVIYGDNAFVITFTASEDTYADFLAQSRNILTSFTFNPAM